MAITFTGINIHAKDPECSTAFYKGLGLLVKAEGKPGDKWYCSEFDIGSSTLWVWRAQTETAERDNPPITLVLGSSDIDGDYIALKENDYAVREPELMFYGGKEMHLTDPDGNHILILD